MTHPQKLRHAQSVYYVRIYIHRVGPPQHMDVMQALLGTLYGALWKGRSILIATFDLIGKSRFEIQNSTK